MSEERELMGYTTGGTMDAPNWDELLATVEKFRRERDENDRRLVNSLNEYISKSGKNYHYWAGRLCVPFTELIETLNGQYPVSARFWDGVRRAFGEANRS